MAVAFKGYALSELDTIIVERYVRGSQFLQKVDSGMVVDSNVVVRHDTIARTLLWDHYYQGFANLGSLYDYKIVVPSVNRNYQITEIVFPPDSTFTYPAYAHGCTLVGLPDFTFCEGLIVDGKQVIPSTSFSYPYSSWPYTSVSMLYLSR